ncbi:PilX N-terminal domain-containing pilus assembly protein [Desulforhopalus singaporensis]|uniref:PilX N-terminal n=1 Tax=Desulforhopalus singaporensis TaxID=91360 RepID=A0A1H0QRC0_9BACT|nr:PilX N-terminal domain-containing pilus assembly protein [Desulforhopalus singaporensis]SDP19256.1 PilX N-terminal [Desulforhopalus singaporensis]
MKAIKTDNGYVLVLCMLILLILSIIGIAAVRNTSVELQIAGNDNLSKKTFYNAEAAAVLATEILEQNLNCPAGFSGSGGSVTLNGPDVTVYADAFGDFAFYYNNYPWTTSECNLTSPGSPTITYPDSNTIDEGLGYSKMYVGGIVSMLPGGSIQMAAGYEGKGKTSAGGGSARLYDIVSVNNDTRNSESTVVFGWRHVVGDEDPDCKY